MLSSLAMRCILDQVPAALFLYASRRHMQMPDALPGRQQVIFRLETAMQMLCVRMIAKIFFRRK